MWFSRNLPDKDDLGTTDPYAEVFLTQEGVKDETKLGQTATISDDENPDWGDVFEFDYDPSKRQVRHYLHTFTHFIVA